jgi:hypothetical protein
MEFISMAHPSGSAPEIYEKIDTPKIVKAAIRSITVGQAMRGF